ncbi:MAG: CDP-alcohol phosphatidyltransferase family protein [Fuerstiella sp.]
MMQSTPDIPPSAETDPQVSSLKNRYLTIPNVISIVRLVGSVGLIGLAVQEASTAFVVGFVVLSLSDNLDGRLARWLNQRSDLGARLDSVSDAVLYSCLLIGSLVLKWDILRQEFAWLLLPLISYAASCCYGLFKYGRIPSYHTRGAKSSQWLVLAGAIAMLLDWSLWPMRIAATFVTLANLEAVLITYTLPEWTADVLSLRDARLQRSDSTG